MDDNRLESAWSENPKTIKRFLDQKNDYDQLCTEIEYILLKQLAEERIEFSSVSYRAKTLKSFLEKIVRKSYKDPFTEINDFAGVRVVFLYQNDLDKIEKIIKKEFKIIEKVDKLNDKGTDKFGYGAVHYIVKIGKNSSGARYDDLKNLVCEIQVRTVLQDAWAIIDHHLVYKKESEIPTNLQRKLNSLAGLFETADNQFDVLRQEREKYLSEINVSITSNEFLNNELNLDTFIAFLNWKYPSMNPEGFDGQIKIIYSDLSEIKIKSLSELNSIVDKYKSQASKIKKDINKIIGDIPNRRWSSSLEVAYIVAVDNEDFRKIARISPSEKKLLAGYKK